MAPRTKKQKGMHGHFLCVSRFSNWIDLLRRNHFEIAPSRLGEALRITGCSAATSAAGMLESLLYDKKIEKTALLPPVFIIGHWRTGTTYLQDIMCRDPQFIYFDPVRTIAVRSCILLENVYNRVLANVLEYARPMDNLKYEIDSPMEETYGMANLLSSNVINSLAFPDTGEQHLLDGFTEALPREMREAWYAAHRYMLKKVTYIKGNKTLLLKSPDNSCRISGLLREYPGAKYINIHRDPYKVIQSTIKMFRKQAEIYRLQDYDVNKLEDQVLDLFENVNRYLIRTIPDIPSGDFAQIRYSELTKDPIGVLRGVYKTLGLSGFEESEALFREYVVSQAGYQKNVFELPDSLREKINRRMGFYFDYYGYEMR